MIEASFTAETEALTTITDFIRFGLSKAQAVGLYYGHGTDNVVDDIVALILEVLHLPWDVDRLFFQAQVTPSEKIQLVSCLEQRILQRIPVPYITHTAYFCDLSFYVDERVLIPRSPIAELIQQQFTPWIEPQSVTRILDLCTGSACIAIACCYAFPEVPVDAVDLSTEALAVAEINRERHHVSEQLTLIESDCFDKVPEGLYDIIVSNPPYVSSMDMQTLPAEYHHEPQMALEAEDYGLALVHRILEQAAQYLSDHGILIVEVGLSEEALVEHYPDLPFVWLDFERGGEGVFLLSAQALRDYVF